MNTSRQWLAIGALDLLLLLASACSGQDRAPPVVPGVDLARLTTEELNLYRRVLAEELSPCGGRVTLETDLRSSRCALSSFAARFIVHRIEQDDTRAEIAERYVARFGTAPRNAIAIDDAPLLGEKNAPVTLVVFSDFQCPHCANAARKLRTIVEESNGKVRMAFRNFPLSRQKTSIILATAALAAHRQGKFWQLHDALYENRARLSDAVLEALAEEVGIDVAQLQEDMLDPALEARLRAEQEQGEALGVHGTPTIFINGRLHDEPIARLPIAVEEETVRAGLNQTTPTTSDPEEPGSTPPEGGGDDS